MMTKAEKERIAKLFARMYSTSDPDETEYASLRKTAKEAMERIKGASLPHYEVDWR